PHPIQRVFLFSITSTSQIYTLSLHDALPIFFAFAVAIGFAIALFKVTPALITDALPISGTGWFVIVEGLIRVSIFVVYLSLISLLPDLRRVFQYHAAEHKAIKAYEAGEPLEQE